MKFIRQSVLAGIVKQILFELFGEFSHQLVLVYQVRESFSMLFFIFVLFQWYLLVRKCSLVAVYAF